MKVYFIGAGPGDPDLITLRGARLISSSPLILYTGSLVPPQLLASAAANARILDSASMTLDQITEIFLQAKEKDHDVARVHTGDPTIFSSIAEQMRRLRGLGIDYEMVPGVSSFTAAAAALGKELTLPELSQTIIISRMEGRTPMPAGEKLQDLARHRATLALFLSIGLLKQVCDQLSPIYGKDCPVAVVHKASLPEEKIIRGSLGDILEKCRAAKIRSQSIILVGEVLESEDFADSRLYSPDFRHRFRP